MKKFITLLSLVSVLSVLAEIPRPFLVGAVRENSDKIHVTWTTGNALQIIEVQRYVRGFKEQKFIVNPMALIKTQMAGQPEMTHWFDTNVVEQVEYSYRIRVRDGAELSPWSFEIGVSSPARFPSGRIMDLTPR